MKSNIADPAEAQRVLKPKSIATQRLTSQAVAITARSGTTAAGMNDSTSAAYRMNPEKLSNRFQSAKTNALAMVTRPNALMKRTVPRLSATKRNTVVNAIGRHKTSKEKATVMSCQTIQTI